jgi:hypothetical protein
MAVIPTSTVERGVDILGIRFRDVKRRRFRLPRTVNKIGKFSEWVHHSPLRAGVSGWCRIPRQSMPDA